MLSRTPLRLVPEADARRVRAAYRRLLPVRDGVEPHLRAVVEDTLAHPGSLARAQLAFGIAAGSGVPAAAALRLGVAVEYFHAASLIFDDMPAMDDATSRRGRPCPHVVHGEAAATLGALALITRAYGMLWEAIGPLPVRARARATRLVSACLGVSGILDGQARDVHFPRGSAAFGEVLRAETGKTVPLIRLAVVLPAVVGGAGSREIARLERLSGTWGAAYQILDDFKDELLTDAETGKTTARDRALGRPSLPGRSGSARAFGFLAFLLRESGREIEALGPARRRAWDVLPALQRVLEEARDDLARRLPRSAVA